MEKFEHIAYMFNERTKGKKYENYVVNAIYTKINNPELMPVTQQYVKNPKDSRHYYLLDLYFPQLNYGIEVDEGQHEGSEHQRKDKEREKNIFSAIECEEGRIKICQKDGKTLRSFEDITEQIDREVEKINAMIGNRELKWKDNEELKEEVFKRGYFDINDDVVYRNFLDVYNLITGKGDKGNYKGGRLLNNNYYLWVPQLSIKLDDGSIIKANEKWENYLNEDHTKINERDVTNKKNLKNGVESECYRHLPLKKQLEYISKRIVFMKMKDRFNKNVVKFIGVFKFTHAEVQKDGGCVRYYERVSTQVNIADLRKGNENSKKKEEYNKIKRERKGQSGKDYTKYNVNGVYAGGKGKTVYTVVKEYVDKHPEISFKELNLVFADSKIKVGVKKIIRKIEDVNLEHRWRFENKTLILQDGQEVAISNQWGVNRNQGGKGANWQYFLDLAEEIGIKVEAIG